jgi:iron complex outermembrane receptor protein
VCRSCVAQPERPLQWVKASALACILAASLAGLARTAPAAEPNQASPSEDGKRSENQHANSRAPQSDSLTERRETGDSYPDDASGPSILVGSSSLDFPQGDFFQSGFHEVSEAAKLLRETSPLKQATLLQPTPFLEPRIRLTEAPTPATSSNRVAAVLATTSAGRSFLRSPEAAVNSLSVDRIIGAEAGPLVTTDVGSLLRKSKSALGTEVQSRSPVVNDPRIRSSRIGALAASGSHWVPARADLDTALNKIDSRLISDVIVVPGPYSSAYGPGFHFIDFELLPSPRYADGNGVHGSTSFNHQSNGNQWMGQQNVWAGGSDWGVRASYTHRLGSNYRAGGGTSVAADYESRTFTAAYGRDFGSDRSIEVSLLRLDQTDVEFPGFVFDIDSLTTDGYEVTYFDRNPGLGDQSETEVWYNRTDFEGSSRNPDKILQFPFLNFVDFDGTTDADVMSTGYRRATTWSEQPDCYRLTLGHDLRMIKQEVNEIFSTLFPGDANRVFGESPLPRSYSVNPGLFAEYSELLCQCYTFQAGTRVDYVQTDITEDP